MTIKNIDSIIGLLSMLDKNFIPYVSWKNNHEIAKSLIGDSDLDIYIPLKYKKAFINLVFKNFWIIAVNPTVNFPHIEHFYLIKDNEKTYHLHVYFKVITGESWIKEYDLPIEQYLIDNRCKHDKYKIYVLNNKAQAYLFALRHIIKSGSISSRIIYLKDIESYKVEWISCNYKVSSLIGHGPILLDSAIKNSGLLNSFQLSGFINSIMFRNKICAFLRIKYYLLPLYRVLSFGRRCINKLFLNRKKVLKPKGIVIAISGIDGSGKSSMVSEITTSLSNFLTVRRVSLGKPQGNLIELFRKIVSKNSERIIITSTKKYFHKTTIFKSIQLLILAILRFFESYKAKYYTKKGYIVMSDRWPTREFGKMDGPKIFVKDKSNILVKLLSKLEKIIYKLIPAADICYFLEVPVDVAIKRNDLRVKNDKETVKEIRERHSKNNKIRPIAKKFIKFDNDGLFKEKKKELLLSIRNELVSINTYK